MDEPFGPWLSHSRDFNVHYRRDQTSLDAIKEFELVNSRLVVDGSF